MNSYFNDFDLQVQCEEFYFDDVDLTELYKEEMNENENLKN